MVSFSHYCHTLTYHGDGRGKWIDAVEITPMKETSDYSPMLPTKRRPNGLFFECDEEPISFEMHTHWGVQSNMMVDDLVGPRPLIRL